MLLFKAALHGNLEILQYLHNHAVSEYISNDSGQKPIHWAAIKGEIGVVNFYRKTRYLFTIIRY